jgi:copper homeostasis protein
MKHGTTMILEVCVDSLESATLAAEQGADRLELCSRLDAGGLSPSIELYRAVRAATDIPIAVMIRTRPGHFCLSDADVAELCDMIGSFQFDQPAAFVFGATLPNGELDLPRMKQLKQACGPVTAVCHRAYDAVPDKQCGLEQLIDLGFGRVLTSGGPGTVPEHLPELTELLRHAGSRITVMPGGGIRLTHLQDMIRTGCTELHGSFTGVLPQVRQLLHFSSCL